MMWMISYANTTNGDLFVQYGMKNYILAHRDTVKKNGDDFQIFYCSSVVEPTIKLFWWCLTRKHKYFPKFFEQKG